MNTVTPNNSNRADQFGFVWMADEDDDKSSGATVLLDDKEPKTVLDRDPRTEIIHRNSKIESRSTVSPETRGLPAQVDMRVRKKIETSAARFRNDVVRIVNTNQNYAYTTSPKLTEILNNSEQGNGVLIDSRFSHGLNPKSLEGIALTIIRDSEGRFVLDTASGHRDVTVVINGIETRITREKGKTVFRDSSGAVRAVNHLLLTGAIAMRTKENWIFAMGVYSNRTN